MRSSKQPFGVRRSAFGVGFGDERIVAVPANRSISDDTAPEPITNASDRETPHAERRTPNGCSDLRLLQLADSAFPAGGFVHSGGIEAAHQCGLVNADSLADWLIDALEQAGHAVLPLVNAGWEAAHQPNIEIQTTAHRSADGHVRSQVCPQSLERTWPSALRWVDQHADAWLTNHVANRASRAQGQGWIAAVTAAFPDLTLHAAKRQLRAGETPGHFAPWFGATARHLDLEQRQTQYLFLFLHLRSLMSAAVRLALIGPLAAQRLQAELCPYVEQVIDACASLGVDDLATIQPLHDLAHATHDRLYSRLFNT